MEIVLLSSPDSGTARVRHLGELVDVHVVLVVELSHHGRDGAVEGGLGAPEAVHHDERPSSALNVDVLHEVHEFGRGGERRADVWPAGAEDEAHRQLELLVGRGQGEVLHLVAVRLRFVCEAHSQDVRLDVHLSAWPEHAELRMLDRGEDDRGANVVVPQHAPEVDDRLLEGMLRDDELPLSVEARHPGGVDVVRPLVIVSRTEEDSVAVSGQQVGAPVLALVTDPQGRAVLSLASVVGTDQLKYRN